jgi:hypothetical protein
VADKKKRIKGNHYWELYNAVDAKEKKEEELKEWARKKAKELGLYPFQPNFELGIIRDKDGSGRVVGNLEFDVMDEAQKEVEKIKEEEEKVKKITHDLARKYGTWPDLIDPATGEIQDSDIETAVVADTDVDKLCDEEKVDDGEE